MMIASRGAPGLGAAIAFGPGVVASGASLGSASGGDDALADALVVDERSPTAGVAVAGAAAVASRDVCCVAELCRPRKRVSPRTINAIAMTTTADASSSATTGDLERRERRRARRRFITGVLRHASARPSYRRRGRAG
jgi:hypothetical protein